MKSVLQLIFLAFLMLPLAACGNGESDEGSKADEAVEQVEEATKSAADEVTEAGAEAAADVVCCGGSCDAPAGFCCNDGTCGGNHAKLPIAP